jgi:hypothetical protein
MIVRIATEGQYRLDDVRLGRVNEMDNQLVQLVTAQDQEGFSRQFNELLEYIRQNGEKLRDDELVGSDIVLPAPDLSVAEAGEIFTGSGLFPN